MCVVGGQGGLRSVLVPLPGDQEHRIGDLKAEPCQRQHRPRRSGAFDLKITDRPSEMWSNWNTSLMVVPAVVIFLRL